MLVSLSNLANLEAEYETSHGLCSAHQLEPISGYSGCLANAADLCSIPLQQQLHDAGPDLLRRSQEERPHLAGVWLLSEVSRQVHQLLTGPHCNIAGFG